MPKNDTGQGQSGNTPAKQSSFYYFMHLHTRIAYYASHNPTATWHPDQRYYYLDINAGTGFNDDGSDGSLRIGIRALQEAFDDATIYAIEKNPVAFQRMADTTVSLIWKPNFYIFSPLLGDNSELLVPSLIANGGTRWKYGLVYADPNGVDDFPLERLAAFSRHRECRRIDILINISATALKRCEGARLEKYNLDDIIQQIDKSYWYIRDHIGRDQWIFLFGLNWDRWPDLQLKLNGLPIRGLQSLGMYRLDSTRGQRIWQRCRTIYSQVLKKSPQCLIGPIKNISDIPDLEQFDLWS